MLKKVAVILISIFLVSAPNLRYITAKADTTTGDLPGYVDEAFETVFVGIMAGVGAAAHAGNYVEDNLAKVYDSARLTWQTASPALKEGFKQAVSYSGDTIVVAGEWIDSFLNSYKEQHIPEFEDKITTQYDKVLYAANTTVQVNDSRYSLKIKAGGLERDGIIQLAWRSTDNGGMELMGFPNTTVFGNDAAVQTRFTAWSNNPSMGSLMAYLSIFGGTASLTYLGNPVDLYEKNAPDPIFDQVERWLRDRINTGTGTTGNLTLGLPKSVPLSNTGRPLEVTGTGVLLDGVPYTGPITWNDVYRGGSSADMVANLPLLYLDGQPLHWVTGADGKTTLVTGNGTIVNDLSSVQTVPNDAVWVDGVPYIWSPTGALINVKTGEIVTDGSAIGAPSIPSIKPVVPPVTDFGAPTSGLNFEPLLMNAQILTEKFPFSIPWDVMRQLSVFNVEPTTPVFKIDIKDYLTIGGHTIPMKFDVDLAMFDVVAKVIRWFNIIIWDIGLLLAIRKFMPE